MTDWHPNPDALDPPLKELAAMLHGANNVVVFTGAGISTESGIPDFRSPGGIWEKYRPIDYQEFVSSDAGRREYWRRKFEVDPVLQKAAPNRGHRAVAALVDRDKVTGVITQNIDGLHQASGIADARIVELHGNSTYAKCLDCGARYELEPIRVAFVADGAPPTCSRCDGWVKPATISFGQAMPVDAMDRAQEMSLACDLFIAIGSSLVVYPAAGFPMLAKQNGARLVILNREPTEHDQWADLVLNREIGPTLGEVVGVN